MNSLLGTLKELFTQEDSQRDVNNEVKCDKCQGVGHLTTSCVSKDQHSTNSSSNNKTISFVASLNEDTSNTKDVVEKLSVNITCLTKLLEDKKAEV